MVEQKQILDILRSEIEPTAGCTDPGSVCLATAVAAHALGACPETIEVLVSPNLYKNGVSVGIPGTGRKGLRLAAALGALLRTPERGMAILSEVTEETVLQAELLVKGGGVRVTYGQTPDPLYVRALVSRGTDWAQATIRGDYSRVTELLYNGQPVLQKQVSADEAAASPMLTHSVEEWYNAIVAMEPERFRFLLEHARCNLAAAEKDMADPALQLGKALKKRMTGGRTGPLAVAAAAQAYTAAAAEARMCGLNVPIMAIAGSGNHGITNFVGVLSAAEAMGASERQILTALAISSMITVRIKAHVRRMTAFCGCGVAAATGMTAAMVYLLGGNFAQAVQAMQTVLGTIGGMLCDGAKISCAYKLSTAAALAVQAAYLSLEGCCVPAGEGIIGATIEQTFANIGRINNPGMTATDREMIAIIAEIQQNTDSCG